MNSSFWLSGPSCRTAIASLLVVLLSGGCARPRTQRERSIASASEVKAGQGTTDPLAQLGRRIFFDTSLSGSGKLACASCHDPAHAYAPANGLSVQVGGTDMTRTSFRAVPSLSYVLQRTPDWHQERASSFVERLEETERPPFGGFGWDGRFKTLGEQAAFPLLSPDEMANTSSVVVLAELKRAAYADELKRVLGAHVLDDPKQAMAGLSKALERYELVDAGFHPYSSKFDAVLDGKAKLSEQERHGEALFNDSKRGNCAFCHTSIKGADGSHPLFTNFQFEVLGVPRNRKLAANRNPKFYDMGLCGPVRTDQANNALYCGMFKTPSLRNVATRKAFFHNGRFHTLREALEFYVRRDTNPEEFYPVGADGKVAKFDDLPVRYRSNVDIVDLPLTKHKGEKPVWSTQDIDDVIAFLETLTDGYRTP